MAITDMKNIFLPIAFLLTAVVTNAQNFNWTRHYPTDSTKVGGMVNGKMWYCTIHNRFEAYENGITVPIRALLKQKTVSATSYTPTNADNGYVIHLSAAAGATITMPNTLNDDVLIHFIRDTGAGDMVFQNDGTSVLNGNGGVLSTATDRTITIQGGWVSWMKDGAINWYGTGSLGTIGSGGGGGSYTFTASDFNESGSTVSLDYTNAQKASGSQHGFLSSTDWTTFNGKQAALVCGTNIKTINGNCLLGSGDLTISGGTWGSISGTLSSQTDLQSALDLKAPLASPTFTGTVVLPSTTSVGTISNTELSYVDGVTSSIQTQLGTKASLTGTETLTNKRLTARVQVVTSSATVTPNADNDDAVKITAQAAGLTLANPSGTPTNMQAMLIRIKDNGTARTITYGSQYRAIGVTLPVTTVVSKTLYLGLVWNADDSKWDVIGYSLEQ